MRGANQMIAMLKQVAAKFPDRVGSAIYVEGSIEMTESKRLCPVDITEDAPHPGQLRASGRVSRPQRRGRDIWVVLSYGGPAIDYAVHVHENPDALHPVGQWKYLEQPLTQSAPHMAARIARRVDLNRWKA